MLDTRIGIGPRAELRDNGPHGTRSPGALLTQLLWVEAFDEELWVDLE